MNWFHKFFNPHCEACHDEKESSQVCKSCETLKEQLEIVTQEKNRLLDRLLERPAVETSAPPVEITKPHNIPWVVRRQMLEREDRERAKLMREAPKPIPTEDLEKELNIVAEEREGTNASQ